MRHNPLAVSLKIDATKVTDKNKFRIDDEGIKHPVEYLIERERNVKIYYFPGAKDIIGNLSAQAQRLYLFILYHMEPGQDYIYLNKVLYMAQNKIKSVNTFKDAIKELSRYCFVSLSVDYKDVYWINPMLFFCGSRIVKYPDKVIIKAEVME